MFELSPLPEVIEAVRRGDMVVLVDDADRENEGDLMIAAEKVTEEALNFMLAEGKGLVCVSLPEERLRALGIPPQVTDNTSLFGTNFGVSFDHISVLGLGITAQGRAKTILRTIAPDAKASEFVSPGYVFPVSALPGGVLKRRGQTEGSVDLCRLAGLSPGAVICEIMGEHGGMLRGEELAAYCRKHGFLVTSVEELSNYRLHNEVFVRRVREFLIDPDVSIVRSPRVKEAAILSRAVPFRAIVFVDDVEDKEHIAFVKGEPSDGCLVRVHSECLTGDILGSRRCDCGAQFDQALEAIFKEQQGVIIYLHQEGRGIGLGNKLRAYQLQEHGLDTVDANIELGFAADLRDYRVGAQILKDLGLKRIRLMTNNPHKLKSLREFGLENVERVAMAVCVDQYNRKYLEAKEKRMGHLLNM